MEAYIIAGFRTAVTKAKRGGFRFYRPDDLAVDVIKGLLATVPELDPKRVDDLIVGNAVPEAEQGWKNDQRKSAWNLRSGNDREQVLCKRIGNDRHCDSKDQNRDGGLHYCGRNRKYDDGAHIRMENGSCLFCCF
jgi:hypothetical protein